MWQEGDTFDVPEVTAHIRQCSRCAGEYVAWKAIAEKFGSSPVREAPAPLYGRVMREIEGQRFPGRTIIFSNPLRIPAFGFTIAGLILAVAVVTGIRIRTASQPEVPVSVSSAQPVQQSITPTDRRIHFEVSCPDAGIVTLVGDFNGWNRDTDKLTRTPDGKWEIDLPLRNGSYQYQFLIDGKEWRPDPGRPRRVPDGFGGSNSVIDL
jgi:hypothetical protein